MGRQIEIPCEPFLKKFLIHAYGQEPVPTSKLDPLCLMVYNSLQIRRLYDHTPANKQYDDSIIFELFNDNNLTRRNLYINNDSFAIAHNVLLDAFFDTLIKFVLIDNKEMLHTLAIDIFLRKFGLTEDDIKKETLIKNIMRFKHNKNLFSKKKTVNKKFMVVLC